MGDIFYSVPLSHIYEPSDYEKQLEERIKHLELYVKQCQVKLSILNSRNGKS